MSGTPTTGKEADDPLAKGCRQEVLNEHFIEGLQKRRANLMRSALYSL
jgi:hypothetical protein